MKDILSSHVKIAILGILIILQACSPTCGDPALVTIPSADSSPPVIAWNVIEETSGPSGLASSIRQLTGTTNTINVGRNATIKIQMEATDNESGVKNLRTGGGFEMACGGDPTGISLHGILGERRLDMSMLSVCGLKDLKLAEEYIDNAKACPDEFTFSSLELNYQGVAENYVGGTSSSTLHINVVD